MNKVEEYEAKKNLLRAHEINNDPEHNGGWHYACKIVQCCKKCGRSNSWSYCASCYEVIMKEFPPKEEK